MPTTFTQPYILKELYMTSLIFKNLFANLPSVSNELELSKDTEVTKIGPHA